MCAATGFRPAALASSLAVLAMFVPGFRPAPAFAEDNPPPVEFHWQGAGTGGNTSADPNDPNTAWNRSENWTEGVVPGSTDAAILSLSNAGRVYVQDANVASCTVDGPATDAGLAITGGSFFVGELELGKQSFGQAIQSGGLVSIAKSSTIGYEPSAFGSYVLSGGSLSVTAGSNTESHNEYVGYSGTGAFVQTGGSHTLGNYGNLYLGYAPGSTGTYLLQDGDLTLYRINSVFSEYVGYSGAGCFTQTGGRHILSGGANLKIGNAASSTGVYQLSGGSFAGNMTVNFTGTYRQTGGTFSGGITINKGVQGEGTVVLENGLFFGGVYGTGWFHQTGGSVCLTKSNVGMFNCNYDLQAGKLTWPTTGYCYLQGQFNQSGGENLLFPTTAYGNGVTIDPNGVYRLSGGTLGVPAPPDEQSTGAFFRIRGTFQQSGGLFWINSPQRTDLYWGNGLYINSGARYELSGGQLVADCEEKLGRWSPGSPSGPAYFVQTGGLNLATTVWLGYTDAEGVYELQGGSVNSDFRLGEMMHPGRLVQTGGKLTGDVSIGGGSYSMEGGSAQVGQLWLYGPGRVMELRGGNLSASLGEFVGYNLASTMAQSGGVNSTPYLEVGNGGTYEFTGGSLRIDGGLNLKPGGTFDLGGCAPSIPASNSLVNLSHGGVVNAQAATLNIGPNSLLILPSGSDPNGPFKQINNAGMTHIAGSTLSVPPGGGFSGWGEIDDFVDCQGTISPHQDGWIDLNGGVYISSGGSVDTGPGVLKIAGGNSGMSDGTLISHNCVVGEAGTGTFTQTGGTHLSLARNVSRADYPVSDFRYGALKIGAEAGSTGTYILSGGELITGETDPDPNKWSYSLGCIVGDAGNGTLIQSGGTHVSKAGVYLGRSAGGTGVYSMTGGSADLSALYVGDEPNGNSYGRLELLSAEAKFIVRGAFKLGRGAAMTASPGATLRMIGGSCSWQNISTDPAALAGLSNLGAVFEGQGGTLAGYEVAGEDLGASQAGFEGNFALGRLELGGTAGAGAVRLADESDNQPDWAGAEALYVNTLVLNQGAVLDCGGLNLYYANGGAPKQFLMGDCNLDGKVGLVELGTLAVNWGRGGLSWTEGDFTGDGVSSLLDLGILASNWGRSTPAPSPAPIPEPTTLALLSLGAATVAAGRRKRN